MLLSWNEIRARALQFSREWEGETGEMAEYQAFWENFFHVFGMRRRSVALYQKKVERLSHNRGFIDLFWPGTLIVEHKSAGKDLDAAFTQATDYFEGLKEEEKPRYVIVTDYQAIRLYDLEGEDGLTQSEFPLKDFPKHVRQFAFVTGYEARVYKEEDPVNIKAVKAVARLYEALRLNNYPMEAIDKLLTRLVFCFFADDTGIFNKGVFATYLETMSREDGSDIGAQLATVFQVLNTSMEKRQTTTDEDLLGLPYVDGPLFRDPLPVVFGTCDLRKMLLACSAFDWSAVSPVIFGSMFQSVMDDDERHDVGAHYTSEKNILKVISGLFLDALERELEDAKTNHAKLNALWNKIAQITLLDPACGCGNFLVVAYRELRRLELEILKRLHKREIEGNQVTLPFDVSTVSKLSVERMHGIELLPFPAEIAQLSLWLADHLANIELGDYFGTPFVKLPLTESPHIVQGNALRMNWEDVVPKNRLTYILGNPPFIGSRVMDKIQKQDMEIVFGKMRELGFLDYVTAWYMMAARFIQDTKIKCAFVSTNSISQGEQVGILWSALKSFGTRIHFAHRTFKWTNEAPGKAAVYCVIMGFANFPPDQSYLFDYEDVRGEPHALTVKEINPYLVAAPADVIIRNRQKLLSDVPEMSFGNMPRDGGNFILSEEDRTELLKLEPQAEKFIRLYIGAQEFLHGEKRYCLWLVDIQPDELRKMPEVLRRVEAVKAFRFLSVASSTRKMASTPYLFAQRTQPNTSYIIVPSVSSEHRQYVPMGFMSKDVIASNLCLTISDATLYHFGVLESEMHMTWMRAVAGRLKSDYRYSKDIVYNNYPWPEEVTYAQKKIVENAAQGVLDARLQFPNATLADLYNPETMPKKLLDAHRALDHAVDKCYGKRIFAHEPERLEFLFEMYKELSEKQMMMEYLKEGKKGKRKKITS